MTSPEVGPTDPGSTPSGEAAALRCPLCEYDVRGLPEPRCPECGHRFEWEELTDPSRQRVRWLFEHGPGVGNWVRTQVRAWWPWGLWGKWLRPAHRLEVRRVWGHWVVGAALLMVGVMLSVGVAMLFKERRDGADRATLMKPGAMWWYGEAVVGSPRSRPRFPTVAEEAALRGLTVSQLIATEVPRPGEPGYVRRLWREGGMIGVLLACLVLGGPMANLLVLAVMRQSFRRAKVKAGHLWRVGLYAGDVVVPGALLALAGADLLVRELLWPSGAGLIPMPLGGKWGLWGLLMVWGLHRLWCTLSLEAGVRRYLGIPRAWAVAVATLVLSYLLGAIMMFPLGAA